MMNMHARRCCAAFVAVFFSTDLAGAKEPDYATDIAPLFRKYCNGCHNADDAAGGLVLEDYGRLLRGGKRGAAVAPKAAQRSRLYLMLTGKVEPAMPPKDNERPKDEEIATVKAWIEAGAVGPRGAAPDPTALITPKIKLLAAPRETISSLAFSPDGKLLAVGRYGQVRLVSPRTRDTVRTLAPVRGNVNAVSFSPDGRWLVAAAGEPGLFGEVRLFNVADGKLVNTLAVHRDSLYDAAISPDGKTLATCGYDQKIKLFDLPGGKELLTLDGHNDAVYDLSFSPDGRLLASASGDRTVKLWEAAGGRRVDTFGQSAKEIYAVAFSPDGRRVAAAGVDNRIRVWRLSQTAKEGTDSLVYSRFAHQGPIIALAFSPDGSALASAAEDRTLKIWEAGKLRERLLLPRQSDWTPALAFSPDGKQLAVGRLNGTLTLYAADSGKVVPPPKPVLSAVHPRGIQTGVKSIIKLAGKHLRGVQSAHFSHDKIKATVLQKGQDDSLSIWLEISADKDVPRGAYDVWISTEGGASSRVKVHVDDLPQVVQSNAAAVSTTTKLPASFWGVVSQKGDVDVFHFDAKAGQRIVFDLAATRLGSKLNGLLTVFDEQGRAIGGGNDFDEDADPLFALNIPRDGRYSVRVGDLTLGASADHFYRLSVGEFPFVTGVFPLSVPANRESRLELAGFHLPADAAVKVQAGPPGELPVAIDGKRYRFRQAMKVIVSETAGVVEAEPNDAPTTATKLPVPGAASGRISNELEEDVDLFRFQAKAGEPWLIQTQAARRGSPLDSKIEVLDAAGQPVPRLLLQATRDSYITFRPIDSKTVDARVKNWEEMELNEYLYLGGEVLKLFRLPQGPDSGFNFYGVNGGRRCYFDTSASAHALDEPCYIVRPYPVGTKLAPNGLPQFTLYFANDDDGRRKLGRDSELTFTAPADGDYLVRVSDVRGHGGGRFAYRLVVRQPQPDFRVSIAGLNPAVSPGSGKELTFNAERIDGFEGEVHIDVTGLPPGFSISRPIAIQAGHLSAKAVLTADAKSPPLTKEYAGGTMVVAKAHVNGNLLTKPLGTLGVIKLAAAPKVAVRLEPAELSLRPGETVEATLKIERNGFNDRIRFNVNNLPHGVIVDNIGLNGVLIPKGQTQRKLFITARDWVPATSRPFHAVAPVAGTQVSPPAMLHVKR